MLDPDRRTFDVAGIDVGATLRAAAILPGDPTVRLETDRFARATLTPDGPGEIAVTWSDGRANVEVWGDGGGWLAERAGGLLGLLDDVTGFEPQAGPVREAWRRHHRTRVARTFTVWHDAAALILQQRVRFTDAARQWRELVRAWGEAGPGPHGLHVPPDPVGVGRRSYVDFHRFEIERSRAQILINAAREMPRLVSATDRPWHEVEPRLSAIRGVGPWTRAGVQGLTWGDADTVIVGDIGLPGAIAWFLAREERADDARMLELLEPHRPHRYRVLQLALATGGGPPRRHHRLARNPIRGR